MIWMGAAWMRGIRVDLLPILYLRHNFNIAEFDNRSL